ncbi:putative protein with SCP / Tpx-1 / Ag5 / PR-1 / Sc7 family of extracellular domains [Lyophyllum shimeji]|uniref:SCP domain-containing protein n=1 Tax=Lyophyllum shimeji TaxID=47721 RepID=A0A9P3PI22_LYOSH|nr:putative protein with SCP / Tpx-1 / Ag5 / PR-1 / Sc7 family of extracellular domains [Lyophyllum shimeji]
MTRLASLLSVALLVAALPGGLAGPACAKKHFKAGDCVQKCRSKWGWPGRTMGTDHWGGVMKKANSTESPDAALSKACGIEATQTSVPTQPVANAQTGSLTVPSSIATTSSAAVVSHTSAAASSVTKQGGFSSSSSVVHSASSIVKPVTSTAIPAPPKTTPSSPPPPVTSSSTHRFVPQTTSAPQPRPSTTKAPVQSTPPSTGGTSSGTLNSDIQAYLSAHNTVRANHGAAPLTWSDDLASKAQEWADGCVFQHSGGKFGRLGENLAAGTGSYSIQEAVKSWTDEVSQYDPSNPQPSHFTQVVWKATTQVGCAVQSCDGIFDPKFGKAQFYVCEYSPAGNVIGQFAQNVQA